MQTLDSLQDRILAHLRITDANDGNRPDTPPESAKWTNITAYARLEFDATSDATFNAMMALLDKGLVYEVESGVFRPT